MIGCNTLPTVCTHRYISYTRWVMSAGTYILQGNTDPASCRLATVVLQLPDQTGSGSTCATLCSALIATRKGCVRLPLAHILHPSVCYIAATLVVCTVHNEPFLSSRFLPPTLPPSLPLPLSLSSSYLSYQTSPCQWVQEAHTPFHDLWAELCKKAGLINYLPLTTA